MDYPPLHPQPPRHALTHRDLRFGLITVLLAVGMWNSILYGGFNLGFALFSLALLLCSVRHIKTMGTRFGRYETALLICAGVLTAGFARSSDISVKAVAFLASLLAVNLSFCLASGQNCRDPGSFSTLFDGPRAFFTFGFGGMGATVRGLEDARKQAGAAGKKGGAALLGVLIATPVLMILIPLLVRSDAAFEAMVQLLPKADWTEPFFSLLTGLLAAWVLFARNLGLGISRKTSAQQPAPGPSAPSPSTSCWVL